MYACVTILLSVDCIFLPHSNNENFTRKSIQLDGGGGTRMEGNKELSEQCAV